MTHLLVNRCTILRWSEREPTAANHFEPTADYIAIATGVRCNIQVGSGSETATAAGQQVTFDAVGYFAIGTDLQARPGHAENDQLLDEATGARYQVAAVFDQAGRQRFWKALLRAV